MLTTEPPWQALTFGKVDYSVEKEENAAYQHFVFSTVFTRAF